MVLKKEIVIKIKALLEKNPQGLSITDIVKVIKINRNTVGRYLENLLVSGQVEMRRFGMTKIYAISQRVPLSSLLSISSDSIVLLDGNLRIIFANEPFLNLIGTDSNNLLGKNIEYTPVMLVFEESFTGFIEAIKQGIAGKEWSGEIELRLKKIVILCRISPTVYENGQRGVSIIIENISGWKQAERALLESEAKLQSIGENSQDIILILNKKLDIIYISRTFTLNPNEVCGKSVYDFVPHKFHPITTARFKYVLENGKPAKYDTEYYFGNDKTLYFESTVGPVLQDGKVAALVIIARDVTERKKAEYALQESEKRSRQLLDLSPDSVIIHDGGKIVSMNPSALAMLRYR
jgi:PAS domain S-box-containing protein